MIDILLPAYNSENYITEQLASIFSQSFRDFRVLIRDDGSTDGTLDIIDRWCSDYPNKIVLLRDDYGNLGVISNISNLLACSDSEYIMFADHDDVWDRDKIMKTYGKMLEAERETGGETPVLVHTDLEVVNDDLSHSSGSFFRFQNIDPIRGKSFNRLLMQNCVTGCTVMINRSLADIAGSIPVGAAMHDWWLSLAASAFGRIELLDEETIKYRQHASNEVGAKKHGLSTAMHKVFRKKAHHSLSNVFRQAETFANVYRNSLSEENIGILNEFCSLPEKSFLEKRLSIVKNGFYKQGFLRNLGLFFFI